MPDWVRPYGYRGDQGDLHTLRYVVAVGASAAGLLPLCGLPGSGVFGGVAIGLFVSIWQVVLWRVTLVGVYVSDHGIKIRTVFRTRIIPWSQVTRVWAGQAAHYDAWQIWLSARDPERDLETPIWRRGSRARHGNRIFLPPDEFAAVLDALNAHR
ncbi:PH domain-containing protein [Micromonospora sp. NPDC048830]|uniref:PH domain-containing protein n=1 Tax=Micromonospora sp. NPDC048830 TaxID=3364257 RepID=UPI0037155093